MNRFGVISYDGGVSQSTKRKRSCAAVWGLIDWDNAARGGGLPLKFFVPSAFGPNSVSREAVHLPGEEAGLVVKAQAGDREAFASLVECYWERLYRWLCHLTRDSHAAEDLAQETFLKAFAALGSFRAGSNFRAWLFRIAHNNFVNQKRAAVHSSRQPMPCDWPEDAAGPAEEVLSREALELLAHAVSKLPIEFRSALMLRAESELSFREIGEVMKITEETARWRMFKARQKLMTILEGEAEPSPRQTNRKVP